MRKIVHYSIFMGGHLTLAAALIRGGNAIVFFLFN
jgi:hypothetical protein